MMNKAREQIRRTWAHCLMDETPVYDNGWTFLEETADRVVKGDSGDLNEEYFMLMQDTLDEE